MESTEILLDGFGRIRDLVHGVVDGLSPDQLGYRIDGDTNSIAWLVWHLTRIQDDHIADAAQTEQVWTRGTWADEFSLPFDSSATGYGHDTDEVAAVQVGSGELLTSYHDAVFDKTVEFLQTLSTGDLDAVVDDAWDPPVTLGVRLVSVVSDDLQHVGQAALIRGLLHRRPG